MRPIILIIMIGNGILGSKMFKKGTVLNVPAEISEEDAVRFIEVGVAESVEEPLDEEGTEELDPPVGDDDQGNDEGDGETDSSADDGEGTDDGEAAEVAGLDESLTHILSQNVADVAANLGVLNKEELFRALELEEAKPRPRVGVIDAINKEIEEIEERSE